MSYPTFKKSTLSLALFSTVLFSPASFAAAATDAAAASDAEQLFATGLSEREAGDYEASIKAFQGILSSEPTLNRARAELAVSYFRALNFAAAKAEAEKVLADPTTPEGVKNNVKKFLEFIDKESRTHVFTPYITFGIGHDSNINVGPSSSTINLGGAQLVAGTLPISKNFSMINAGVSHRYLSPTPITAFGRSAAYLWQSNVNYYRNDYFSSGDYDLDVLSLSTGPAAVVAERWRAGVDFTYDYIVLGHNKLADFYGVSPSVTWNISKNTDITVNAKFQQHDFKENITKGRDSFYQTYGINVGRAFFDSKLTLQAGASYFDENADINRFSNDGYQLSAGANYRVAPDDSIYLKDVYKSSKFDDVEALFNIARDENENRASLGFNHRFSQNFVKDWTMDASVTYTQNDANIPVYEYRRTQFALTFGKYF
jgi:Protein of unknown function (DUF2860)